MAQCKAKSKASGKQCMRSAMNGGVVCQMHGGMAPQVKAKALERLAARVDPAITKLGKLIDSESDAVALNAVKDVLDRNDIRVKSESGQGINIANVGLLQLMAFSRPGLPPAEGD